jgi:molybdate/tungstate transport system ATP-binding protein
MLSVEEISITRGTFCLQDLSFEIPRGSYAVLMGRTGCGKTSVLEAICGLVPIDSGQIVLCDQRIDSLRPGARHLGLVPQDGALFPTMSVGEQIAFGPTIQKWPRKRIDEKVATLAGALGISSLLDRRPFGLSGGERQRVALARALAVEPRLLCLDEPLSALDEDTRSEICDLLMNLKNSFGFTALHVTHSASEAQRLGDLVIRMQEGRIVHAPR